MARTRAGAQTAYDLGFRHGADDDASGGAPDYIATNSELLEAYDRGLRDGTDSLDAPDGGSGSAAPAGRRHRASARPHTTGGRASSSKPAKPGHAADGERFAAAHPTRSIDDGNNLAGLGGSPTLHFDGNNIAGFILGMALYAVGLNFVRNGPAGAAAWFNAKFFNKVDGESPVVINDPQTTTSSTTPATPATPAPAKTPSGSVKTPAGAPKTGSGHLVPPSKGVPPKVAPAPKSSTV